MRTGLSCGRDLDHLRELPVALAPLPTLPGLMRYLDSACAQAGWLGQQLVAVVVEVADQRHVDAHAVELLADRGTAAAASAC
jgi:hypothetical protein